VHAGVLDLRIAPRMSCWREARTLAEGDLVARMMQRFEAASLDDLVSLLVSAHRLPPKFLENDSDYMRSAHERESWAVRYVDFCCRRYTGESLHGDLALEAGCGAGGTLPHLTKLFAHVIAVDVDLPTLLIAAKRCEEHGVRRQVTLVAAELEQNVLRSHSVDVIKCTDVIEHVGDPANACENMARWLKTGGKLFILTPNKWSPWSPEPHVGLWGVQFLPPHVADMYVRWRIGIAYTTVARLLSYREMRRILRRLGSLRVTFVPIEDKYLNPLSERGIRTKRMFARAPLRWLTTATRFVQPSLDALCVKVETVTGSP
jgi:2-polyprenyl-3-methyl-5-hydroxy-6-metoxy-1,4-benzoquinol methylase